MSAIRLLGRSVFWAVVLANVGLFAIGLSALWARPDAHRDMIVYYQLAERLRSGLPMYDPLPVMAPQVQTKGLYLYPPFFAAPLRALPPLPWLAFSRLWTLLVAAGVLAYAVMLARLAARRYSLAWAGAALLVVLWCPGTIEAIGLGQVDPLLWLAVAAAVAYPRARGAGLAAAALVKPFTLVALVAAAFRERRVVRSAAWVVAGWVLLAAALLGPAALWRDSLEWLRHIAPSFAHGSWNPTNVSLTMLPLRMLRELGYVPLSGPLPEAARLYLTVAGLAVPALVAWALRRHSMAVQCSMTVAASVLCAPICWTTYLPLVLLPVATIVGEMEPERRLAWA